MRKTLLLFGLLLSAIFSGYGQSKASSENLKEYVYFLAADSLRGRYAGSQDARRAAQYIEERFREEGLLPYGKYGYRHNFNVESRGLSLSNVIGLLEGNDPFLKEQYIVVGAHYDHLGMNKGSNVVDSVYNGADDNASGVASLIEMARLLKDKEIKRSIIFVAFDGEEQGLFGSKYFVEDEVIPLKNIAVMISMDMVGYYAASGVLGYSGVGTIEGARKMITDIAREDNISVHCKKFEGSILTATDTQPFAMKGIPTLAVCTGMKSPYHKPQDEADRIDYDGLALVAGHVSNVVENMATDSDFCSSGRVAAIHDSPAYYFKPGIKIGMGSSHFTFMDAPLLTKNKFAFNAGMDFRIGLQNFEIVPEIRYDNILNYWQSNEKAESGMEPWRSLRQQAVTVPLSFGLRIPALSESPVGIGIKVEGYYRYIFSAQMGSEAVPYNQNEWGWGYGLNFYLGPVTIGIEYVNALTDVLPDVRNRVLMYTIGYSF